MNVIFAPHGDPCETKTHPTGDEGPAEEKEAVVMVGIGDDDERTVTDPPAEDDDDDDNMDDGHATSGGGGKGGRSGGNVEHQKDDEKMKDDDDDEEIVLPKQEDHRRSTGKQARRKTADATFFQENVTYLTGRGYAFVAPEFVAQESIEAWAWTAAEERLSARPPPQQQQEEPDVDRLTDDIDTVVKCLTAHQLSGGIYPLPRLLSCAMRRATFVRESDDDPLAAPPPFTPAQVVVVERELLLRGALLERYEHVSSSGKKETAFAVHEPKLFMRPATAEKPKKYYTLWRVKCTKGKAELLRYIHDGCTRQDNSNAAAVAARTATTNILRNAAARLDRLETAGSNIVPSGLAKLCECRQKYLRAVMKSSDPAVLAGATLAQRSTADALFIMSRDFFDPAEHTPGIDWSRVGPNGGVRAKTIMFAAGGGKAGEAAWDAHVRRQQQARE